jgi:hypothetical protein
MAPRSSETTRLSFGLPDAGVADEDGVVLRAAGQHLHDAPDLLVAADDRVELALAREVREVLRVFLERLVLVLGALIGDAAAAPHVLEGREDGRLGETEGQERLRGSGLPVLEEREEEVLGGDVVVLEVRGDLFGEVQQLHEDGGEARLGVLAGDVRELREELRDLLRGLAGRDADALEERGHDAAFLLEEGVGEVFGRDFRMALGAGRLGGLLKDFLGLVGEAVEVHGSRNLVSESKIVKYKSTVTMEIRISHFF